MLGLLHLLLHISIYSVSGMVFYSLRSRLSLIPFYIYIGILQVLTSLVNSFYVLDVGWGVSIGGGSIIYAAVIWSVMLLYVMERDLQTTKIVILGILAIQFVFLFLYPYYGFLLSYEGAENPLAIPSTFFQISFGMFWVGNILALVEMVLMVFLLEKAIHAMPKISPVLDAALIYILIMVVDSVLFPLFAFPVTQSISVIQGLASLMGKLLLGAAYAFMLVVGTQIFRSRHHPEEDAMNLRLVDMLSLPKTEVIRAWRRAEENESMVKLLLDLLGHDIRNYNDTNLKVLDLIGLRHPELKGALLEELAEIRRVEQQSTDLVSNIMTLTRIQENGLKPEDVNLSEVFKRAKERVSGSHNDASLIVSGEESLEGLLVRAHPLLEEVFYNILSNMVRHRKSQCDSVHVDVAVQNKNRSAHVILVDDGPGITDEDKIRVFDSIKKRPRHRSFGLYLVKAILNQLDCDIWIENRPDSMMDHTAGSAFHLRFPL